MRKNEEFHKLSKRFMECCSEIQKCNLDNKAYNEAKSKYANAQSSMKNQKSDTDA